MSDKNFKVKNGLDANGAVTITQPNTSTIPLIIKANSIASGSNMLEMQRPDGTVRFAIGNDGALTVNSNINFNGGNMTMYPGNSGQTALIVNGQTNQSVANLIVKAATNQSGNLQEWRDQNNNLAVSIGADFALRGIAGGFFGTANGNIVGVNYLGVKGWAANHIPFAVQGYASQTGDLTRWVDSSASTLAKIDSAGNATFNTVYVGLGGGSQATNIGIGGSTLSSNTTGFGNSAIGFQALQSNTTGWGNIAIGTYALQNYSGNVNTAIGFSALRYATSEGLVAIGYGALASNTSGNSNTAVGYGTLNANIIGGANTAFGSQALRLATGDRNTSIGFYGLYNLTTGTDNVSIGSQAGQSFTTGSSNTVIGSYAAWYGTSTGSNNVFIGRDSGGLDITGSNNIAIGYNTQISSSSVSNEITMGNSSITKFRIPGTGFVSDTSTTYSAKELDLRDVSTQFANTNTGSVGQKINLWGGIYGIGIEGARLVNYIPSTSYFTVKNSYGGADLFTVSGSGPATLSSDLTISGNLTVNGTTTNLNSTNLVIEDKNIILADVATPTDTTADGAGITIKGATDKTFNWVNSTKSFTTSESLIVDGTNSTSIPMLVKVPTNQTTNAFEVRDGQGYSMFKVVAPAGGTAYNNGSIWIRPWGTGNVAAMGTDSYQGFYFVSPSTSSINFGTGGGGKSFEIVVGDTFNRYRVEGTGTGVAPILTTNGNDTDINMNIYPKGAGKIGINTTSPTGYVHIKTQDNTVPALVLERPTDGGTSDVLVVKTGTTTRFSLSNYGMVQGSAATFSNSAANTNIPLVLINTLSTTKAMTIKAASSQSAALTEWQDSSANVLMKINADGSLQTGGGAWTKIDTAYGQVAIRTDGSLLGSLSVGTGSPVVIGAVIKGAASQTASLQEWQDSSGNIVAKLYPINPGGDYTLSLSGSGTGSGSYSGILIGGSWIRNEKRSVLSKFGVNTGEWHIASNPDQSAIAITDNQVGIFANSTTLPTFTIKGAASQTANLQEWQNSSGTALTYINSSGVIVSTSGAYLQSSGSYGIQSTAGTATTVPIIVQGASSQTANLQQWQDSSSTIKVKVDAYGQLTSGSGLYATGGGGFGAAIVAQPGAATLPAIIAKNTTSQTANVQEWQNSDGTVFAKVSSTGGATFAGLNVQSTGSGIVNIGTAATGYVGLIVKAVSGQTANLTNWYAGDETLGTRIGPYGELIGNNLLANGIGGTISGAMWAVIAGSPGYIPIIAKGAASQTSDLQQWQNSSGTVLTKVNAYGRITINSSSDAGGAALYVAQPSGGYGVRILGAGALGAALWIDSVAAGVGTIIRAAVSQTANLQEWQNSGGTVIAKVDANGNFTAISKSFDIEHPTKENMRLRYASLEGPENGVYIRGTAKTNIIELPDYWTGLVHEDSITVSLTPIGSAQNIYVEKIENNKVYIGGDLEKAFFTVYGERKDIDKLTVEY